MAEKFPVVHQMQNCLVSDRLEKLGEIWNQSKTSSLSPNLDHGTYLYREKLSSLTSQPQACHQQTREGLWEIDQVAFPSNDSTH